MARVLANDPQSAATAHVFAFQADLFNRCFDFHTKKQIGLEPSHDSSTATVRIELHGHFIADKNADFMKPHLAREIGDRETPIGKLHPKERVRKRLFDDSLDNVRFSHICAKQCIK
jgi:hypothetical protein